MKLYSFIKKERRSILALIGTLIVFGTFIAKDTRRDNLKDLAASIDSAENVFVLRTENLRLYDELRKFEGEFREFRQHPTTPVPSDGGGGSSGGDVPGIGYTYDWEIELTRAEVRSSEEVLDKSIRLFNKLPDKEGSKRQLESIINETNQFWTESGRIETLRTALSKFSPSDNNKPALARADHALNSAIYPFFELKERISRDVEAIGGVILQDAEKERTRSEEDYRKWADITKALYAVGFFFGLLGILLGEPETVERES
jgi:hypothetical protein